MQVIYKHFKVLLISQSKRDKLLEGEGQALAQTAAAREQFVRQKVTSVKRKRSDNDQDLPVSCLSPITVHVWTPWQEV